MNLTTKAPAWPDEGKQQQAASRYLPHRRARPYNNVNEDLGKFSSVIWTFASTCSWDGPAKVLLTPLRMIIRNCMRSLALTALTPPGQFPGRA